MTAKTGFLLAALACGLCRGQVAGDSQPAVTNVMGAEYPRVHSDLRVTFRLAAPEAHKVQVRLGQTYDMAKDAEPPNRGRASDGRSLLLCHDTESGADVCDSGSHGYILTGHETSNFPQRWFGSCWVRSGRPAGGARAESGRA